MTETTTPVADPYGLMHWISGLREHGDLAPMLIVVRRGVMIASGFIDPPEWFKAGGVAMYGFDADAIATAMDTWMYAAGDRPPTCTPREAFEAGDPRAFEALALQWIPRHGSDIGLSRRYADGDPIQWLALGEILGPTGPLWVPRSAIQNAVAFMRDQFPEDFDSVAEAERDAKTAEYLGLELR